MHIFDFNAIKQSCKRVLVVLFIIFSSFNVFAETPSWLQEVFDKVNFSYSDEDSFYFVHFADSHIVPEERISDYGFDTAVQFRIFAYSLQINLISYSLSFFFFPFAILSPPEYYTCLLQRVVWISFPTPIFLSASLR